MESVGLVVTTVLRRLGIERRVKQNLACTIWNKTVGQEIAVNTKPVYVNSGILFVAVKSATWAHQLSFFKHDLITRLNDVLGSKVIKDIRFQVGFLQQSDDVSETEDSTYFDIDRLELDEESMNTANSIAENVVDEDIKARVERLLIKNMKSNKWKAQSGWKECSICGVLTENQEGMCLVCRNSVQRSRISKVKEMLAEIPWTSYEQMSQLIPSLTEVEYQVAHRELVNEFEKKVEDEILAYLADRTRDTLDVAKASTYELAFLVLRRSPDEVSINDLEEVIGENRYKLLFEI